MNIKSVLNKQNFGKVAFPHEHGSWGFFLEPIVLALVIGFSSDGLLLGISSFLLFLASQSLSIILKRKPKYLLTQAAFVLISYCIIALILFFMVINSKSDSFFLFPFISALVIMIFYKYLEVKNQNRILLVELLAPISVVLISVSIIMLKNWEAKHIIVFGIVLLSRSIQTVYYVNNKLKFFKEYKPNIFLVNVVGAIFFVILLIFSIMKLSPYLSLVAIFMLIVRAHLGFLQKNKKEKVKTVGIKEFIYGFLFVVINSIGYLYKL